MSKDQRTLTPAEVVRSFENLIQVGASVDNFVKKHSATLIRILNNRLIDLAVAQAKLERESDREKKYPVLSLMEAAVFECLKLAHGNTVSKERLITVMEDHKKNPPSSDYDEQKQLTYLYATINDLKPKAAVRGYDIVSDYGIGYVMWKTRNEDVPR